MLCTRVLAQPSLAHQSQKGVPKIACTECINCPSTMKAGLLKCCMDGLGGCLVSNPPPPPLILWGSGYETSREVGLPSEHIGQASRVWCLGLRLGWLWQVKL